MDIRLKLKRIARKPNYTIGRLYIERNSVWHKLCDTLEDYDRIYFGGEKVKDKTAIPTGTYRVLLTLSPKYQNRSPYKEVSGGIVPLIDNVPNFAGIRIHIGNTENDTSGCVLVGENKVRGRVVNSTDTWIRLWKEVFEPAKKSGDKMIITIE